MRAHAAGGFNLAFALGDGNHVAADGLRYVHKHQSDRARPDDSHGVANFHSGFMQSAKHARQRFYHGRFFKTDVWRNSQHVEINNAARHANIFGVSSVIEKQVFAKIFLMARTVEARLAWGGIQRDHAHAFLE